MESPLDAALAAVAILSRRSPRDREVLSAVARLRALLSGQQHSAVIDAGAIKALLDTTTNGRSIIVAQAAGALADISSSAPAAAQAIAAAGGIPRLHALLVRGSGDAKAAAATALSAVSRASTEAAQAFADAGIIPALRDMLADSSEPVRAAAAAAFILISISPPLAVAAVDAGVIPLLCGLLADGSAAVRRESTHALIVLVRGAARAQAVVDVGGLPLLCGLLADGDIHIHSGAATVLKNMCSSSSSSNINSSDIPAAVAAAGAIPLLCRLLAGNQSFEAAVCLLSSISRSTPALAQAVADGGPSRSFWRRHSRLPMRQPHPPWQPQPVRPSQIRRRRRLSMRRWRPTAPPPESPLSPHSQPWPAAAPQACRRSPTPGLAPCCMACWPTAARTSAALPPRRWSRCWASARPRWPLCSSHGGAPSAANRQKSSAAGVGA